MPRKMELRSASLHRETSTSRLVSSTPGKAPPQKSARRKSTVTVTPTRANRRRTFAEYTNDDAAKKASPPKRPRALRVFDTSSEESSDVDSDSDSDGSASVADLESDSSASEELDDESMDVDDEQLSDKENRRSRGRPRTSAGPTALRLQNTPTPKKRGRPAAATPGFSKTRATRNLLQTMTIASDVRSSTRTSTTSTRAAAKTPSAAVKRRAAKIPAVNHDDDDEYSDEYEDVAAEMITRSANRVQHQKTRSPFTPIYDGVSTKPPKAQKLKNAVARGFVLGTKQGGCVLSKPLIDDDSPIMETPLKVNWSRLMCDDDDDFVEYRKATPSRGAKKDLRKEVVTPIRIQVSRTPGGSMNCSIKNKKVLNDERNEQDQRAPLKLILRKSRLFPQTTAEKLKGLATRLHLSQVPEKLPCRDQEATCVRNFIAASVHPKRGESSAMFIGGCTGTGKTATVRTVRFFMRQDMSATNDLGCQVVQAMQQEKKQPDFIFVEVNAIVFHAKIFVELYRKIQNEWPRGELARAETQTTARKRLNAMFADGDPRRPHVVMLIDELDALHTKKQDVLYDIFNWTAVPESRVTIIAIANTIDFPERMLLPSIASRFDKHRVIFQPYEFDQIEEIINARLTDSELVASNAVKLVSRKVAMAGGDLRRALHLLQRCLDHAARVGAPQLTMEHVFAVQAAEKEPLRITSYKQFSQDKALLFRAVLTEMSGSGQEEAFFAKVFKTYCVLSTQLAGLTPLPDDDVYRLLHELSDSGFVAVGGNKTCGMRMRRIRLAMTMKQAEDCVRAVEATTNI